MNKKYSIHTIICILRFRMKYNKLKYYNKEIQMNAVTKLNDNVIISIRKIG
jgi:hypothetical protein